MSHDAQLSRLVYMANQIGTFFASRPEEEAIAEIEGHIRKFWDPRMRRQIASLLDREDSGLSPRVHKAVLRLNQTLQMSI
ncbi:formate dehydrogenase subunit delta [Acidiphilium acidophilum]|uniref:formate dehydrogenase subunit delta n=1 Tax=Acidiphilium acidophilum TaxID=76588 RepID=UPI002E8E6B79|nr:formate dehydrogenase subunit delta [Acidiphilium acidophilum]